LKLFKDKTLLRKILFIEFTLIFSGLTSFLILAVVKSDTPPSGVDGPRPFENLLNNYSILYAFTNLPDSDFTPDRETKDNRSLPLPRETGNKLIDDIVKIEAAESFLDEKKYARAENILDTIRSPHDFLISRINLLYLKAFYFQQKFRQFIERYNTYPMTDDLRIQLLRINCLIKIKKEEKAFEIFRKLFLQNRLRAFQGFIASTSLNRFLRKLTYDDWYKKFDYLARKNYFSEFKMELRYAKAPQLQNLFYAEFYYRQKQYGNVIRYLGTVTSPPLQNHKKKLLLKIGLRRKNYEPEDILDEVDELKDDTALYSELLFDAASILLIQHDLDTATALFSKFIDVIETNPSLPKSESEYWKALWLSAWIHLREKRKAEALECFEKGLQSDGETYRMANTYWYHRLKKSDTARPMANFAFSYYYTRARGSYAPGGADHKDKGLRRFISLINGKQSPYFLRLVNDLKTLLENRMIGESFAFIRWAKTETNLSPSERNVFKILESVFYLKQKNFYYAFVTFRKNFDFYQSLRLPKFLCSIYSPIKYRDLIEVYSERFRLDPNLVLALVREESFFRPNIVSPAKANGLMQLLYSTARQIALRRGMRITKWDLYKPDINISLGTDYLRELLDRYDNKLHLVLAAYNAGVFRVDSWLDQFGNVPDDQFIEMIPFTETRGYVKNILRNYYYYGFYYGE
jgi:hypothetical protein